MTTTTTTTTTTTAARPIICPSAVWHPNATTVAGSVNGAYGSTTSLLHGPSDIFVTAAFSVYVADFWNYRVMKWLSGSVTGTTVGPQLGYGAGPDTQHLDTAAVICFDSTGSNLYILDNYNCRVLKWNLTSNNITIVAGGNGAGTALNQFYWGNGVYVDRFGYLYVSDYGHSRVLKFPPNSDSSTMSTLVAGTGTAGAALNQLNTPWGIYVDESDNNTLYIADYNNHRVMKWRANATSGTIAAGGNGAGALYTQLYYPISVIVDSFGTVYVGDYSNDRIVKWLKNATIGTLVAGISSSGGALPTQLNGPAGIRFDTNGHLYVADDANNRVQKFPIDNTSC